MEHTMKKIPSISSICEKGSDGSDTYDARLYQHILKYSIRRNDKYSENIPFTVWELTWWLINTFDPFRDEFKELSNRNKSRPNKILSKLKGIESKIDDLTKMELIERLEPRRASRGAMTTNPYKYTESGYIVTWTLESIFPHKKTKAEEEIYNILDSSAKDNPSSYYIFVSTLYEKYQKKGVFGEFVVDRLRTRLTDPQIQIMNIKELFMNLGILHFADKDKADLYSRLWSETMDELDEEVKEHVLQQIKLELEWEMGQQVKYIRGFEELRIQLRDRPNILALEGVCQSCGLPSPIQIETMEYLENTKLLPNDPILVRCRRCNKDASITVPQL
jgi:hypothetical protein